MHLFRSMAITSMTCMFQIVFITACILRHFLDQIIITFPTGSIPLSIFHFRVKTNKRSKNSFRKKHNLRLCCFWIILQSSCLKAVCCILADNFWFKDLFNLRVFLQMFVIEIVSEHYLFAYQLLLYAMC